MGGADGRYKNGTGEGLFRYNCGSRAHSLAGDISALLVDRTGSIKTAAALVHLAPRALEVGSTAALPGAIGSHLARAGVLTVARALSCDLGDGEEVLQAPHS